MLSHHAPPRFLLSRFSTVHRPGEQPCLWVYSKLGRPRQVYKVTAESAERGYFKGDPFGRTEKEIEGFLNEQYELPFNKVLPALSAGLISRFDSGLIEICAKYMAGLFLRSKPRREATKIHSQRFSEAFHERLKDDLTLRRYAAKVSLHTGLPVLLNSVREAALRFLDTEQETEESFFQSATTDFSQLPSVLRGVHWALCYSPHAELLQSDAAVALLFQNEPSAPMEFGFGIQRPGSQWYLPISPRYALRASMNYMHGTELSFQQADLINEYLVRVAHGFVYSASHQAVVEQFVRSHINSLHFFEHLVRNDLEAELDEMFSGLLS